MVRILLIFYSIFLLSCSSRRLPVEERPSSRSQDFIHQDIALRIDDQCYGYDIPRLKTIQYSYDSLLYVAINLSTSDREGPLDQKVFIYTDEYELEYHSKTSTELSTIPIKVKASNNRLINVGLRGSSLINPMFNLLTSSARTREIKVDTYINYVTFYLEDADQELLLYSNSWFFKVVTTDCEFIMRPSRYETETMKHWLQRKRKTI